MTNISIIIWNLNFKIYKKVINSTKSQYKFHFKNNEKFYALKQLKEL